MDNQRIETSVSLKKAHSQSLMLRIAAGVVFLFLGVTQFSPSQQESMAAIFESGIPYLKDWIGFRAFAILLGGLQIFFSFWLLSGRLIRLAGLITLGTGIFSISCLFTLQDQAWDKFPFLLSAGLGQVLIKDLLLVGIGFFMLFEKRVE